MSQQLKARVLEILTCNLTRSYRTEKRQPWRTLRCVIRQLLSFPPI